MSGSGSGGSGTGGRRRSGPPSRVTLQFEGLKLALPGEADPGEPLPSTELQLDTGEFHPEEEIRAAKEREAARPLNLDLEDLEPGAAAGDRAADGWARLRESEAPGQRRSTPPPRGEALDLVGRRSRPPSTPGLDLARDMEERFALGDFSGALRVAELLLGRDPEHAPAQRFAESSRERLIQIYTARLAAMCGSGAATLGGLIPRVAVLEHEIRWLGLDHRQGFLLSRLDGRSSVDDLVDLTGMPRLEVLRTLVELMEAKAIRLA